jgi:hypothetical protein
MHYFSSLSLRKASHALEPYIKAFLSFCMSWHQNSLDAYYFIIKYGKKPIYTDGALWYVDACRWAGVDHFV